MPDLLLVKGLETDPKLLVGTIVTIDGSEPAEQALYDALRKSNRLDDSKVRDRWAFLAYTASSASSLKIVGYLLTSSPGKVIEIVDMGFDRKYLDVDVSMLNVLEAFLRESTKTRLIRFQSESKISRAKNQYGFKKNAAGFFERPVLVLPVEDVLFEGGATADFVESLYME